MNSPGLEAAGLAARLGPVAVVSTFSPSKDGIARYADQLVTALARYSVPVRRIGLAGGESGGDEIVDVSRGTRFLRVVRGSPRGETILVMWHPAYLTGGRQFARSAALVSLALGFRLRRTIVLQHEPDDDLLSGVRGLRRIARMVEEYLRRVMWRGADEIWFHSEYERDAFRQRYRAAAAEAKLELVTHGTAFAPSATTSQADARRQLGVPMSEQMFVCVGFLSLHKGLDRVVRAFSTAAPGGSRLWIVGSAIKRTSQTRIYIDKLHAMAAEIDNVEMSERYLDDEEFDLWLTAADFAVLAYRSAASSGVIPRAHMLGTRVIGSGVGGTAEQLRPRVDIVASSEAALVAAFRQGNASRR